MTIGMLVVTMVSGLVVTGFGAIQPTDFSGVWVLEERDGKRVEGPTQTMAVGQTSGELTVESSVAGTKPIRLMFRLDGVESPNAVGRASWRSTAAWQGATLVIRTTRVTRGSAGEATVHTTESWTLEDERTLVMTTRTVSRVQNGKDVRLVFRRK